MVPLLGAGVGGVSSEVESSTWENRVRNYSPPWKPSGKVIQPLVFAPQHGSVLFARGYFQMCQPGVYLRGLQEK